jgi:hypothetical protein
MPVRVNLKELFPSDSQEITIDKVNFNFNKLLELGIGEQGLQGLSGIQGPAGPTGDVGPAGLRGSTWFVDAGDPNTLTGFGDLLDNDLYLDSNLFDVWQYDEATDNWSLVTSISNVVNNYLSTTPSPFRRGLGLSSPEDDRFITFNRRGNTYIDTQFDVNLGTLNAANSDTLFLNNFDENVLDAALANFSFTAVPGELFNSLLSIYANHSEGASALQGRYHLEMGTLYENTEVIPSQVEMSELRHNLKVKFLKEDVSSTTTLTNTNYWINTARFSLGKLEAAAVGTIDQNGQFEFVVPKYNNEGMSPVQTETTIRFGSAESLIEQSAVPSIVPDGISISSASNGVIFGLKEGLETILNLPYSAGNADFALFDVSSGLNGFFFNDRIVQSDGNIEQIHTTPATFIRKITNGAAEDGTSNRYYSSIFSNGKYLITTFAGQQSVYGGSLFTSARGLLSIRELDSELTLLHGIGTTSQYSTAGPPTLVDNHGHYIDAQYADIPLTGVTDVAMCGKYLYITKIMPVSAGVLPVGTGEQQTTFIVAEMDSDGANLIPVSLMDFPTPPVSFRSLQRVEIVGSTAYVINKREPASPWNVNFSSLNSIDITDPTAPVLIDTQTSPTLLGRSDDHYLDLAIFGERAFVSTFSEPYVPFPSDYTIRIKRFDIHDPSNLSHVGGTVVVNSGVTEKPAQLEIQGTWLFCSYDNDVYIYDINDDNSSSLTFITSLEIDPDIDITDILVNGNYLYVLGEDVTNTIGMLATVDISDIQNPFVVALESRSEITAPGKMTLVGNRIYVATSQGTGLYSTTDGGISVFEIDGILSPAAEISSLRSNVVKVSKNVQIGESLDVGNSVNVGQGGVYIDKGQGLSVDGPIKVNDTITLIPQTTVPASPTAGMMYFDSGASMLKVYDGATWQDCW